MASLKNIPIFFLCIFLIYLIDSSETKPNKKRHHHHPHFIAKCTSDFLWEALSAAGKGNDSATDFLSHELHTIGFTKDGIRSRSIAANWQSKLTKTPSESIFSNLQKLGAIDLTKRCPFCESAENVEILPAVPEPKPERISSAQINMKHLVKAISKLFADNDIKGLKMRTKRLRRILKKFWNDESLCEQKSTSKPPSKKKSKGKHGMNSTEICLRLIRELLDRGLCEDVNESFHWTYVQIEQRYREKNSTVPIAVTVEVP